MASRSLHSHQFTLQRMVGALAMRDPNPVSSPLRSLGGALLASILVAALSAAAVAVYGLLRPGGDPSWRTGESVIVERETGARFVFRDGVLHPVVNYSSALLILGSARPETVMVARTSLAGVPRGAPLGIPGAPDLLPATNELVDDAWLLCSRPASTGKSPAVESALFVGASIGGTPEPFDARAMVARDVTGALHLLWNNRRYPIRDPDVVLAAFAWPRHVSVPVATAVLNAVPVGADIGPVRIPGATMKSNVDGLRVGAVVVVANQSGHRQYGVITPDGVADITEVQAGLLLAAGANGIDGDATVLSQAKYAALRHADPLIPQGDGAPPARAPTLVPAAARAVCATFADGATTPVLSYPAAAARAPAEVRVTAARDVGVTVDWVAVIPGRGVVVAAVAAPEPPTPTLALVSDRGVRYPVPSDEVLAVLGYPSDVVTPMRLPTSLVALLPTGPALDPVAAILPMPVGP